VESTAYLGKIIEKGSRIQMRENIDKAPSIIKEMMEKGEWPFEVDIMQGEDLSEIIKSARKIDNSLIKKDWQFYTPPSGEYLLTSDNPVYYDNAYFNRAGPAHSTSEVVINLRKDLALVITYQSNDKSVFQMNRQKLIQFNKGVTRAAKKYVYSNKNCEALGRMISKIKETRPTLTID